MTYKCKNCKAEVTDPDRNDQALSWQCPACLTWQAPTNMDAFIGEPKDDKPGLKHDDGKIKPRFIIEGFPRALIAVAEVATFGDNKYTEDGWVSVPDGVKRYTDAKYRHALEEAKGEELDPESKLKHAAHEAWNTLARLELMLREEEKNAED